jgi:RNA polymerase sigma factor (sigma-70 family)
MKKTSWKIKNKTEPISDDELMNIVAKGGEDAEEAYTKIYHKYYPYVYNLAYNKTSNREMSEEIAHDTLSRVWEYRSSYKNNCGSFKPWLRKIANNKLTSRLRVPLKKQNADTQLRPENNFNSNHDVSDIIINNEEKARDARHLDLLSYTLDKTLHEAGLSLHIERWCSAAKREISKTKLARKYNKSLQKFQKSVTQVEPAITAGTLVETLLSVEPNDAFDALLSKHTIESPARIFAEHQHIWTNYCDKSYGLPYWNAENTKKFDEICGLAPKIEPANQIWLEYSGLEKLVDVFGEFSIRVAENICLALDEPGYFNELPERYITRDDGFLFLGVCPSNGL